MALIGAPDFLVSLSAWGSLAAASDARSLDACYWYLRLGNNRVRRDAGLANFSRNAPHRFHDGTRLLLREISGISVDSGFSRFCSDHDGRDRLGTETRKVIALTGFGT